ncbi:hypothetical protein LCGC14_2474740, partial [marine sediment metagenome]
MTLGIWILTCINIRTVLRAPEYLQPQFLDSAVLKSVFISSVNNPTYEEESALAIFLNQPELLPSGSWKKIIAGFDDHFGEEIHKDNISELTEYERDRLIMDGIKSMSSAFSPSKAEYRPEDGEGSGVGVNMGFAAEEASLARPVIRPGPFKKKYD